jgi:L-threonate 2-dehydrogenase
MLNKPLIGFVGLGNIGLPLAKNLLAAGYSVQGFDIKPNEDFERAGGVAVTDVAALACAQIIVQSLPSADALVHTLDQLLPHCGPSHTVIEISSYALEVKKAQAERLEQRGAYMVDCEISGLPFQAAERKAVIFKSGDIARIEALKPVFDAMADQHFYLGAFGGATKMKLIANTMVCVHTLMAAEALNLGKRAGLDPALMVKVLGPSAAGSTTFTNKAPLMLSREFRHGRGPFRHMFGYLSRTAKLATNSNAATPLLYAAQAIFIKAELEKRHDEDIAAVLEVLETLNPEELVN